MAFQNRNNQDGSTSGPKGRHGVPKRKAWLSADPIYQRAAGTGGDIPTAWENYQHATTRAVKRTKVDAASGLKDMATQKRRDIGDMNQDFASRGMAQSGVYVGAQHTYEKDYKRQVALAKRAKKRGLTDIKAGKEDQRNLKNQQIWNARNEALLRRIQKYGLPGQGA